MNAKPFTPKTLSERWDCSEQHVRDLIKAGKLKGFQLGGLIRIAAWEVERVESGSDDEKDGSMPSGQIQKREHKGALSAPRIVHLPNAG